MKCDREPKTPRPRARLKSEKDGRIFFRDGRQLEEVSTNDELYEQY